MESVVSILSHPLSLLIIGAALTGWLLPRVGRRWQDQRKALEVKASLVERVTRAVMDITTATQFTLVGAASQSQEDFDKAYREWQLEKWILTSIIGAYFRNADVSQAWLRCRSLATAYYVQSGIRRSDAETTAAARVAYLRSIEYALNLSPPQDASDDPRSFHAPPGGTGNDGLVDVLSLRDELQRALTECVAAIVDGQINLTSRSKATPKRSQRSQPLD